MDFSKNLSAQMTMLNKVNIQSMRRKDVQKKVKEMATTLRHNMSVDAQSPRPTYAGVGGGTTVPSSKKKKAVGIRHNSQQASPRMNGIKIMDLNDTFLAVQ